MSAGRTHGLPPYGSKAGRVLRLGMIHNSIGQNSDTLTSPDDPGCGWAVSRTKPFLVRKRALELRKPLGRTRVLAGVTSRPDAKDFQGARCPVLCADAPASNVISVQWPPTLNEQSRGPMDMRTMRQRARRSRSGVAMPWRLRRRSLATPSFAPKAGSGNV